MNEALRKTIGGISAIINFTVTVFLVMLFMIGMYAIWDTKLVHTEASSHVWRAYKPSDVPAYTFDELKQKNSDVVGWIELYGTGIDYPVMYSPLQDYYLSHDPFNNHSAIGSIYLDSRCSKDFSDFTSILYGHHMEASCMMGDVTKFQGNEFFNNHLYGDIFYNDTHHGVKVIGALMTTTNDSIVRPAKISRADGPAIYNGLKSESVTWRDGCFDFVNDKLLLLYTCNDSTDTNRAILITAITDETFPNPFEKEPFFGPGVDDLKGWLGFPWVAWFAGLVVVVMVTIYILWQVNRTQEKKKLERMVFNNDKFEI